MGIEIHISTESGRVKASATGSEKKSCKYLSSALNLSDGQIESALRNLRNGYRGPLMKFGCKLEITPDSDDIKVSESTQVIAVASDTLRNRSSVPGTYTTTLREDVTHTVNVKWSSSETVTKGFEIGGELYIKGSGHMDFSVTTGQEVSKQRSEAVGSTRSVSVRLEPGQAVRAKLVVKRRTIKVRVPLTVEIKGHVAAGYGHIERQPETIDLKDILEDIGRRTSYTTEAIINIVCFTDADVVTEDY